MNDEWGDYFSCPHWTLGYLEMTWSLKVSMTEAIDCPGCGTRMAAAADRCSGSGRGGGAAGAAVVLAAAAARQGWRRCWQQQRRSRAGRGRRENEKSLM